MSFAVSLILCAAFLHAFWNSIVKGSGDRVLAMGFINAGHVAFGVVLVVLYLPPAVESWPFLVASTIIHWAYYLALIWAYGIGDLSRVYPIARGIAPVTVALSAQVFLGEVLPLQAWIGLLLVTCGIGLLVVERNADGFDGKVVFAAIVTGMTIAAYSVVDGAGVRASGSALGYIGWLFLLEGFACIGLLWWRRDVLRRVSAQSVMLGIIGGLVSSLAYALAIYAKSLTSLGTVSAIRESSVIIAAMIGVVFFGERPWRLRLVAALIVAVGVIVMAGTA